MKNIGANSRIDVITKNTDVVGLFWFKISDVMGRL